MQLPTVDLIYLLLFFFLRKLVVFLKIFVYICCRCIFKRYLRYISFTHSRKFEAEYCQL